MYRIGNETVEVVLGFFAAKRRFSATEKKQNGF